MLLVSFLGRMVAMLASCCVSVMLPACLATGFGRRTGVQAASVVAPSLTVCCGRTARKHHSAGTSARAAGLPVSPAATTYATGANCRDPRERAAPPPTKAAQPKAMSR
jgi:hypothetical protein